VLSGVDLRNAVLDDARFESATMKGVQLEGVRATGLWMAEANLVGAHFTASTLPGVDLSRATLTGAGLGEVDWPHANLRNASLRRGTFHMVASRSGLVGAPYACEGSKTGFYTDDYEDLSFKRPEDVRK